MPRTRPEVDSDTQRHLFATGEDAPSIRSKASMIENLCAGNPALRQAIDLLLLEDNARKTASLAEIADFKEEAAAIIKEMTLPPNYPATFICETISIGERKAVVVCGNQKEVVTIDPTISFDRLYHGIEVYLNAQRNCIIDISPFGCPVIGETGVFDRYTPDGTRIIINSQGEEFVLYMSDILKKAEEVKSGDLIRWDRDSKMAFEILERSKGEGFFLEDTPTELFKSIGGLEEQIGLVQNMLNIHIGHKEMAAKYGLQRKGSVLLVGPSGTGKTMLARALANYLGSISKSGQSRFINVKPGQMNSMWYGQTEQNYREIFRIARESGEKEPDVPVVMFFDEIDSIAQSRGSSSGGGGLGDRMLNAFMAELDGLEGRGNVVVVAATNRREAIDPAMLRPGRLGDMVLDIPRPNKEGTKDILNRYMTSKIPFYLNGNSGSRAKRTAREKIVQAATDKIFSKEKGDVLAYVFMTNRSNETRRVEVRACDLVNGAILRQAALTAAEKACNREIAGGDTGVKLEDMMESIHDEFRSAAQALAPESAHNHLPELPHDEMVSRVQHM